MRREYVCTISSHAAPSPARHLRTNSAPSLIAKALTAPTVSSPGTCWSEIVKGGKPLFRLDYDRYQTKVQQSLPQKAQEGYRGAACRSRSTDPRSPAPATAPALLSRAILALTSSHVVGCA